MVNINILKRTDSYWFILFCLHFLFNSATHDGIKMLLKLTECFPTVIIYVFLFWDGAKQNGFSSLKADEDTGHTGWSVGDGIAFQHVTLHFSPPLHFNQLPLVSNRHLHLWHSDASPIKNRFYLGGWWVSWFPFSVKKPAKFIVFDEQQLDSKQEIL